MTIIPPRFGPWARRGGPGLCLCLLLLAAPWCAAPRARGQARPPGAQPPPAELEEAERLGRRVAELYAEGKYVEAVPAAERALAIYEKALGPGHERVAAALDDLAALYREAGDYARAEPLYLRALSVREKGLGPDHPEVGSSLNNLALLYDSRGDHARAEPLYLRSLAITEKALGPDHPEVAATLNNLAFLYRRTGDSARAEPLYLRALAIFEKALGPEDTRIASALNNLAPLYYAKGDYARAEQFLLRSLSIREKALGPDHPSVAQSLNNLALVYKDAGDHAKAEPLYLRALAAWEKTLGPEHPQFAAALSNLVALFEAKGEYARAVQFGWRAEEARERHLALILQTGSERQKLAYLDTLSSEAEATVSLHARSAPSDPEALRLALTTVLRRKGRALDAMSDQLGSLRARLDAQDRALLDRLSSAQSRLAALVLGGPGGGSPQEHRAEVRRLVEEAERLQDEVSRRSEEFRARAQAVTVERVQAALPADAALVEFFTYHPFDAKAKVEAERFGPPRYVAYVLRGEGGPRWADLGRAEEVDAAAALLRAALRRPTAKESKGPARALDELVMRPVRGLLGDARRVFVSPDGALNLVPFAALVDEGGKYLVENYSLTYLTSGRDLLRLQVRAESRQPPLILADPLFDGAGGGGDGGGRAASLRGVRFGRLPGTAEEAAELAATLPGARLLTRADATESALKAARAPSILHVATHGFFLPGGRRDGPADAGEGAAEADGPLLRSGLALEGANRRRGAGGEDGILTALEAAGLDLWGTRLVVLSACETGVGTVRNGEGVYGLRRALVLAGSESQLMSLWKVDDYATRELMAGFYRRLKAGEGRSEALRQVQLKLLGGGEYTHPFFWAGFILSGDWRPLGGRRVDAAAPFSSDGPARAAGPSRPA